MENVKEKIKKIKFIDEFKKFIARGNVIELAIGLVMGSAFTAIVNSLVANIFTPFINWIIYLICGQNTEKFKGLDIVLIPATYDESQNLVSSATVLSISSFISAILNFFLVALAIFLMIKAFNRFKDKMEEIKDIHKNKKEAEKAE